MRTTVANKRAASTLIVVALIATGCGGGGDTAAVGGSEGVSFARQASVICNAARMEIATFNAGLTDRRELRRRLDEFKAITGKVETSLGALQPPDELRDGFRHYMERFGASVRALHRLVEAQARDRQRAVEMLATRVERIDAEANELALEIGLNGCAGSN